MHAALVEMRVQQELPPEREAGQHLGSGSIWSCYMYGTRTRCIAAPWNYSVPGAALVELRVQQELPPVREARQHLELVLGARLVCRVP